MSRDEFAGLLTAQAVPPALAERLAHFGAFVLAGNARCNLTAARTPETLVPHILDSLTLLADVEGPLVDIGSGGGFPAIPIALAAGVRITMIESTGKKAKFLRQALEELQLDGEVLQGRAEDFALDEKYRERFARATARAVATAPAVLEYTLPFLAPDGLALLQRGVLEDAERRAAADASLVLGGELIEERLLEGSRRILLVRKVRPTPWRFPRKNGMPVKKPLCL